MSITIVKEEDKVFDFADFHPHAQAMLTLLRWEKDHGGYDEHMGWIPGVPEIDVEMVDRGEYRATMAGIGSFTAATEEAAREGLEKHIREYRNSLSKRAFMGIHNKWQLDVMNRYVAVKDEENDHATEPDSTTPV